MIKAFLEAGQIVGTHGVRGEMRVNPWCDAPDFLRKFKTLYFDAQGRQAVQVKSARVHGNLVLLTLQDVTTMEAAAALRGKMLYLRRADANLPEGSYFIAELQGCQVLDADDNSICYGTLTDVSQTGANDVWYIEKDGQEYLIPAIPDVVVQVDVAQNTVFIRPLKGIFDDAD